MAKDKQVHMLYHMATGSGKTYIMAGMILYYYKHGYRNFLFFVNQGNPYQRHVYQQMIVPYFLYFGDEVYRIDVTDATAILDFISEKASSCADWDLAREFDRKYKHMEYKILSQYFKVTRVK